MKRDELVESGTRAAQGRGDSVSHHHLDGSTRTVGKVTMLQRGSAGDTPSQLLGRLPVPPWVD